MKIGLLTTFIESEENDRIAQEVKDLGHAFELIDANNFGFTLNDNIELTMNIPKDLDILIVRGILHSIKPIATIVENMRATGTRVFDNSLLAHKYSINKITDLLKLFYGKIPVPVTGYVRNVEEWEKLAEKMGYPLIVKSIKAGKGYNIFKVGNNTELKTLSEQIKSNGDSTNAFLLQQYFDYEHDLRCLVIGGQVFTMKRIPSEGEFRANFSLGGRVEPFEIEEKDKQLAIEALKVIGMSVGGVDILIGKDTKRVILEVNHTAGFIGMELALGENIGKIWVEHAIKNAR